MPAKKGVLSGPKFNGRHTTYIKEAEPLIVAATARPEVTKILPGVIDGTGGKGGKHFRIRPQQSGALKLIVSAGGATQTLFVYTTDPVATTIALQEVWDENT